MRVRFHTLKDFISFLIAVCLYPKPNLQGEGASVAFSATLSCNMDLSRFTGFSAHSSHIIFIGRAI